jgi:predicted MPP superfamily phosphohydrolase
MVDGPLDGLFHGRLPPETVILTGDLVYFQGHDTTQNKKSKTKSEKFLGKLKKCQK